MSELVHSVGSALLSFGVVCLVVFVAVVLWQLVSTRRRLEQLEERARDLSHHDDDDEVDDEQ